MARLASLLALVLAACPQDIQGLDTEPPDATAEIDSDADTAPEPDAGKPPRPDAGAAPGPDAGKPAGPDAGLVDLGACAASPSPARVGQAVAVTCPGQPSMTGPSWSVDGVDGGYTVTPGTPAGAATFTLDAVPKNFADSTLRVRARWHGASSDGVATAPVTVLGNLLVGRSASPGAIAAFTTSADYRKWGSDSTDVVGATEFNTTPRAMALKSDGDILVAQSSSAAVPAPVFVLGRADLKRIDALDFAARDNGGAVLFDIGKQVHPRAVAQMKDGTVWVTGGPRPVIFGPDGKYRGKPGAGPTSNTVGLAQLSDGRIAVSFGTSTKLGLYSEDGATYTETEVLKGGDGYSEIAAICPLAEGGVVLSLHRFTAGKEGGLLVQLDSAFAFVRETPSTDWTYQEIHSQVVRVGDEFVASPEQDLGGSVLYRYGPGLERRADIGSGYGMPRYSSVVQLR